MNKHRTLEGMPFSGWLEMYFSNSLIRWGIADADLQTREDCARNIAQSRDVLDRMISGEFDED